MATITLKAREYRLMQEALRRYTMGGRIEQLGGDALTEAWTGLGTAAEYRPAVEAGLMEIVPGHGGPPAPRVLGWWRLTSKGAKIVQAWLDAGWRSEDYETPCPPSAVEI